MPTHSHAATAHPHDAFMGTCLAGNAANSKTRVQILQELRLWGDHDLNGGQSTQTGTARPIARNHVGVAAFEALAVGPYPGVVVYGNQFNSSVRQSMLRFFVSITDTIDCLNHIKTVVDGLEFLP